MDKNHCIDVVDNNICTKVMSPKFKSNINVFINNNIITEENEESNVNIILNNNIKTKNTIVNLFINNNIN